MLHGWRGFLFVPRFAEGLRFCYGAQGSVEDSQDGKQCDGGQGLLDGLVFKKHGLDGAVGEGD